jgi:predicted dehydrogenase
MIRVAVVGLGSMGKNHARIYRDLPDVELVALVDSNPEVAEKLGRRYKVPTYPSVEIMLQNTRPDAVSVVVPTQIHHSIALPLLEAGCHIMVEKPIANSTEQAKKMIETAKEMDRVLMVGHIERFNPAIIELKQRLQANELGKIYMINTRRLGPFPSRVQDVGVIMDLAPHDLDIMRYLTDSEVIRIIGDTRRQLHTSHEDLFNGILRFEDGTVGVLEINWLTPTKIRELTVTGERGMFMVNYVTQDLWFFENADTRGEWPALGVLRGISEGAITKLPIIKREPLLSELEYFIGCVQNGHSCEIDGDEGLAALSLALSLMEASQTTRKSNGWIYV